MRKLAILLLLLTGAALPASALISTGTVPGLINYQGRLERDGLPYSGALRLTFRIYDSATGGDSSTADDPSKCVCHRTDPDNPATAVCPDPFVNPLGLKCLWSSGQLAPVTATLGIFNAAMEVPLQVLSTGGNRYLEVQVGSSDILSPREPINSVFFALVAKRLENEATLNVSSITISVASSSGVTITPSGIYFPDSSVMTSANVGMSTGGVISPDDVRIVANAANSGGDTVFYNLNTAPSNEKARITSTGRLGIGVSNPGAELDVNGSAYIHTAVYGANSGAALRVGSNLNVDGGQLTGANNERINLGAVDNEIQLVSGGSARLHVANTGFVGVGLTSPQTSLHAAGVIYSTAAVRGSSVAVGSFQHGAYTALGNEIRTTAALPLVLQNYVFGSDYYVGIGTAAPSEKLHVKGSVFAESGVRAATAAFTGPAANAGDPIVNVQGNFRANSGLGSYVQLSSTTIFGSLTIVNGTITVQGAGGGGSNPAFTDAQNSFVRANSFSGTVQVSSDTVTRYRLAAGAASLNFPSENNYLQVGDSAFPAANGSAYVVGGANANARVKLFRGSDEAASLETQGGRNLALVVDGQTRLYSDASSTTIKNAPLWVGGAVPALYADTATGRLAIGTSVTDPAAILNVHGNIRISTTAVGQDYGLIFPDGSKMTASSGTSVTMLSNNGDAVVESAAGSVLLKSGGYTGLAVRSGGNVSVGGSFVPSSLLNVRGGDLVLGNPSQSGASASEDLIVSGNIITDGAFKQRSTTTVEFFTLTVASTVYLSTSTLTRTRIGGNTPPARTLDVTGDIGASGSIYGTLGSGGAGATWNGANIGVPYGGTGVISLTAGSVLLGNGTGGIANTGVLGAGKLLIGNGTGAPTIADLTGTSNQVTVTPAAGSITLSQPQNINTTYSPTFAGLTLTGLTGVLKANGASALSATRVSLSTEVVGQLPAASVAAGSLGSGVIVSSIALGTIYNADINASAAIAIAKLATSGSLGSSVIVSSLAVNSVYANAIANNSVSGAKIALGSDARGDVMYYDGSNWARLAAGTSGEVLKTQGAGADPLWGADNNTTYSADGQSLNMAGTTFSALPSSVTLRGNTFNSANRLVLLDGSTRYPGLDASLVLRVSSVAVGAVEDASVVSVSASKISGVLDGNNGGTGSSRVTFTGPSVARTYTLPDASTTILTTNSTISVGQGGTGATSLTGFVRGSGTSALTASAIVDADVPDDITISGTNNVTWASVSKSGSSITDFASGTLSATRGGTGRSNPDSGKVLVGDGSNPVIMQPGQTLSFIVAKSTNAAAGCMQLNYSYGVLASTATATCP